MFLRQWQYIFVQDNIAFATCELFVGDKCCSISGSGSDDFFPPLVISEMTNLYLRWRVYLFIYF